MSLILYVKKWKKSPVFVKNIFMMVSRRSWLFVKNVISVVYAPLCHIPGASASLVPCPSFTGLSVSPACRYRQAETKSVPSTLAFAMRFFLCLVYAPRRKCLACALSDCGKHKRDACASVGQGGSPPSPLSSDSEGDKSVLL